MSIVRPTIVRTVLTRRKAQNNSRQVSTASILLARAIEFTSQTVHHRRGLLALAAGFFLGGGGLSGAALLSWNSSAAVPVEEDKQARRRRKAEAKLAAQEAADSTLCAGLLQRWVWWPWYPHWKFVDAEVRRGLLLLRAASSESTSSTPLVSRGSGSGFASGERCVALPLAGASAVELKPEAKAAAAGSGKYSYPIELTTAAGEHETLRLPSAEEQSRWSRALQGERDRSRASRRVVEVQLPPTWEAPFEQPRIVLLDRGSAEFKRVERLALSQQFQPSRGQHPYVTGKLVVTDVFRVQQPHLWEQYAMRRAIIAAENDGESTERQLWHGTPVAGLITKEGFDPRVCSLDGMFGGGVYFADKSSKSVRYAGASKKGDSGTLLLCRVSLGRPMLKWLPQPNMRRPPDPFPLFGMEHFQMWRQGRKFHSVFANCDSTFSPLIMNEYIVYHTNQGYPEYVVQFELK